VEKFNSRAEVAGIQKVAMATQRNVTAEMEKKKYLQTSCKLSHLIAEKFTCSHEKILSVEFTKWRHS